MPIAVARWFICALPFLLASAVNSQSPAPPAHATPSGDQGSWKVLYEENFENPAALFKTGLPSWVPDAYQNTDAFSDGGEHFQQLGVKPPAAYRAEGSFGKDSWLTIAAYSRSNATNFNDLFQVVPDPADPANHVLKLSSPRHTDGIVVRPTNELPAKYRVCVKVGYASFGDGKPGGLNG